MRSLRALTSKANTATTNHTSTGVRNTEAEVTTQRLRLSNVMAHGNAWTLVCSIQQKAKVKKHLSHAKVAILRQSSKAILSMVYQK